MPGELAKKHIPTYAYTINTLEETNNLINNFGVTEIYTDFLPQKSGLTANGHCKTANGAAVPDCLSAALQGAK